MPKTMSPFRYPGGKTQLYSFVNHLLKLNSITGTYIEPFAGGSGLAIKLLLEQQVENVWINDYDKSIYSVWYAILNKPRALISKIREVPFDYNTGHLVNPTYSIHFWRNQKATYIANKNHQNSLELAFATLFLNRTNTSGIINGGPLGGLSQKNVTQIYARFNKETLIQKIESIHQYRKNIRLTRMNALKMIPVMENEIDKTDSFIFFDPPYFEQGKNLYYSSFDEDGHRSLSNEILSLMSFKWITTYDKSPQISDFYSTNDQNFEYDIRYSANNKKRGRAPELMFASPCLKIDSFDTVNLEKI